MTICIVFSTKVFRRISRFCVGGIKYACIPAKTIKPPWAALYSFQAPFNTISRITPKVNAIYSFNFTHEVNYNIVLNPLRFTFKKSSVQFRAFFVSC